MEYAVNCITKSTDISEPYYVPVKKGKITYLDKRQNIVCDNCSVVISITDNRLIQTTAFKEWLIVINFTETDIKFIKSNIPNYEKIFKSSNLRDVLIVLSDWISKNGWDESGYNYSSLGRQAQAVYDNIYFNNRWYFTYLRFITQKVKLHH